MKKIAMIISGVVLVIGCLSLAVSLILSAILSNAFLVYLTANPVSFTHDILNPDMTVPYIFSAIKIICGFIGMRYFGVRIKD